MRAWVSTLTIEFAKQKGLNILGFVISGYDEKTDDPVMKSAPDEISKVTGMECLMKVPKVKNICYEAIEELIRECCAVID